MFQIKPSFIFSACECLAFLSRLNRLRKAFRRTFSKDSVKSFKRNRFHSESQSPMRNPQSINNYEKESESNLIDVVQVHPVVVHQCFALVNKSRFLLVPSIDENIKL